jgi:uncharacterized protein YjlB
VNTIESLKHGVEQVTGLWRPRAADLRLMVVPRKPQTHAFEGDGKTPNNPRLPLVIFKRAVLFRDHDPAAVFEAMFAANGWTDSWRNGMYAYEHFHSETHEVLGIARGTVRARFGGTKGEEVELAAGDVAILPAGTGHKRIRCTRDLLVVGAYPKNAGAYDEPRAGRKAHDAARPKIEATALPNTDPIYGKSGPLRRVWTNASLKRA